ncbi:MAG TPA: PQQ-binding-like beta-propeller repeat protein [Vicinamibacterales bacterium]|nr:PQQ-binding-like beta-propeller repeat protein [Vicinamibacterales bacterium]
MSSTTILRHAGVGLALLTVSVSISAEDWTRFRGPNGSGVSGSSGVPVEFGPSTNVIWKTAVPFGRSSPVIGGDRVFLTASEGEMLIVMALDRKNGRLHWRREIRRVHKTPVYKTNDPAAPSPVTDGTNVYAFFADLGLVSFDRDGKERWRVALGPFDTFYGLGASPILAGDTLLLLCDTRKSPFLLAVDARTGKERWRVARPQTRLESYATPVLWESPGQPTRVIVLGSNRLDGYDVATGERVWQVHGLASLPVGSPVIDDGLLVASTYGADTSPGPAFDEWLKGDENGDGRISEPEVRKLHKDFDEFGAIDANSDGYVERAEWDLLRTAALGHYGLVGVRLGGRGDVTPAGFAWHNKKASTFVPSPLIYQGLVYLVKSGGIIEAVDARTGEIVKVGRSEGAMGEYYASPVAAAGHVYFTSEEGRITVVRAGRDWSIAAVNALGEDCYATPAIADGRLHVRTRTTLYSFGLASPSSLP